MAREIKFRVFDTHLLTYQYNAHLYHEFVRYISDSRYLCEQFTGLKDKNGVDIYEGDMLESGNGRVWEVRFGKYEYYNDTPAVGFYLWSKLSVFPLYGNITVIGNIHQNPELLNQ